MTEAERVTDGALGTPAAPLRSLVTRYAGYRYLGFPPGVHLGLPSRSLTVVIALGSPTRMATMPVAGQPPASFQALASGLHPKAVGIEHDGDQFGVQLDLTPLGARALLGGPAGELAGLVVDLADVLGPNADELLHRMAAAAGWTARFAVLDEVLLRRATACPDESPRVGMPDPLRHAWHLLVCSGGAIRVADLADQVGWSRRNLTMRFATEYGLAPKELARIVRFGNSVRMLRGGRGRTLADVANRCGYYDQAHLAREWRALAGCPPSAWLASDDLPSVQDATAERDDAPLV